MSGPQPIPLNLIQRLQPLAGMATGALEAVQQHGRVRSHEKGRILFRRGEPGAAFVYLLEGSVDLADASFEVTPVTADDERARFPLDDSAPYDVTAVTTSAVRVLVVPRDVLEAADDRGTSGGYQVSEINEAAADAGDDDWMSSLLSSAMFQAVPPSKIQQLFARFEEVRYRAGQVVIRQGEPGEYFYAVKAGRLSITRRVNQEGDVREVELARIGVGDIFGEDALISAAPRNATVTMLTDGILVRLGQPDFGDLLENPVVEYVSYEDFEALRDEAATAVTMLDVRSPAEHRAKHLPNARNLPLHAIRQNLARLDRDAVHVLTCDGGRRSVLGSFILTRAGFDARVLENFPPGFSLDDAAGG